MNTLEFAKKIRLLSLELCYQKKTSHIGGALSVADILAVLYNEFINNRSKNLNDTKRDRVFFSKGHASVALYAALCIKNFFSSKLLIKNFTKNGSYYTSHVNHKVPGIEISTGSLGHALGIASGVAIAAKRKNNKCFIFVIMSDGELNEGSNWESIMFSAQNKLDNIIAIVDYNKMQSFGKTKDIIDLDPLKKKFMAFNWEVYEVNGHNISQLREVLNKVKKSNSKKPKCIIANTIKGKGVKFMENKLAWHYKSPDNNEYKKAKDELTKFSLDA